MVTLPLSRPAISIVADSGPLLWQWFLASRLGSPLAFSKRPKSLFIFVVAMCSRCVDSNCVMLMASTMMMIVAIVIASNAETNI